MTFPYSNMTPLDIIDDEDLSETEFLKNSIATHTKYGSTTNCDHGSQNLRFITHYVEPNDTFQGLSLKYGCKIENIKKYNKLYSDDNNHLRSRFSIVIPIEIKSKIQFDSDISSSHSSQSSLEPCSYQTKGNSHLNDEAIDNISNHCKKSNLNSQSFDIIQSDKLDRHKNILISSKSSSLGENQCSDCTESIESVSEFLLRIDSSIARTKNQVENFSKKVADNSLEDELNRINPRKFNPPKLIDCDQKLFTSNSSRTIFENGTSSRSKKIESSLKRLKKSQGEIFEL
ncbi:hypothetical protein QR98_0059840 [Sarcoptes scabiei]|uniref:Uncharacterized protein n=2 Tax=Sarcoptes scabiei TaxID=52283 RepID=A0A132AAJ2_SARSC|nr:hypothetical protein QR98_0059840 [Sarcoptes scabiei]